MENTTPQYIPVEEDVGADTSAEDTSNDDGSNEAAVDPKADAKAALAKELRKYKVKIDDEEHEVDEDELLKGYQLSKASQKRMQEAANARKQIEEVMKLLKTDPSKAMKQLGLNDEEWAEKVFERRMRQATMTPEQRELEELKQKFAEIEAEKRKVKEDEEHSQRTQLQQHYEQHYDQLFTKALSESGLPKTAHTVKRMVYYTQQALSKGIDLPPEQIAELVREDYMRDIQELMGAADDVGLSKLLGEAGLKKVSKAFNKTTTQAKDPYKRAVPSEQPSSKPKTTASPKLTRDELMAKINSR